MKEVKVKIYGDDVTLHTSTNVNALQNKGRDKIFYYAEVSLHFKGLGSPKYNIHIPLTEDQYKTLSDQFKSSEAEAPFACVEGELEIKIAAACFN